jgi:error-prone DNA polymerase
MVTHSRASLGARALRPLNTPSPIRVVADPDGRPLSLQKPGWSKPRTVVEVQDRWRIDDEWWREQAISRLYYTLLLEDERLVTVYHDLISDRWFEQRGQRGRQGFRQQFKIDAPDEEPSGPAPATNAPGYVELHLHSCYSFLEGASRPEELVDRAVQLGYTTLALTDHNGLHGAMEFAQACATAGLRSITGVELTLRHGFVLDAGPVSLTLLAENSQGYANLCRLITETHRSSPRDDVALDPDFLASHTEGLIVLSGGRWGELARLVDEERFEDALEAARWLASCFGPDNTFVELMHNLVEGDSRRLACLADLARRLGLRTVATGDVYYHDRRRARLQDALVAVKHRSTLEASHRLRRPNSEFFLRAPQEAAGVFVDYSEAISNTALIAERCKTFNLAEIDRLGYEFPDFTRNTGEQDASADAVLAAYCWSRFEERYPPAQTNPDFLEKARKQLQEELTLVAKHNLSGFFLIYRDIQELATRVAQKVRGIGTVRGGSGLPPGRGRGSSVSSLICYLIGLSHVDPVRNRLFFHRFLNEDLKAVPDIDLDFARDIREELILQMYERYGHDHTALVCSFATYRLRSAVRDLGKVLGLPPAAIDKLAKLSEGGNAGTVREELERLPEFEGQADGPLWSHLIALSEQLNGFPRHVSQHVGGMIVSSRPLIEMVPIQPAAWEGRFICQWDKDSCDDARFIKIDFLALGMLSLVEDCLELVWQSSGKKLDLADIDYNIPAIYDAICQGDTVGLFQIESRAQIQMLTRTQPRNLDDLAVQVAIVRPGPIVGGAVNPYVRRRERLRQDPFYKARADHPLIDDLLGDTLGIILYQDQVLEVATAIGGFTPGQADQFRRAMSRRRSQQAMERFRDDFLNGARAKGVAGDVARSIFEKLLAFSEFGFPKSHAYAFAVLAYQSAWLRHYFPAEYYAALFNSQPMGFYAPHVLLGDANRHQISVMRVSINRSAVRCIAGKGHVLLGLMMVRGLGEEMAEAIVAERDANGAYRSLADLLRRTGLPYAVAENLIAVGALSEFGLSRRDLLWQLGLLMPRSATWRAAASAFGRGPRGRRQLTLALSTEQDMAQLRDMDQWERMVTDYGLLGLSPSFHPLGLLRSRLPRDIRTSAQLRVSKDGERVRTAGLVVCRQRPGTAAGFLFILIEDETGLTNIVVSPDLYEAERSVVRGEPYLCVEGTVQLRSGTLNLLATHTSSLSSLPGVLLPRPPLRHPYPGNPDDPREQSIEIPTISEPQEATLSDFQALDLATPASHDFR